ncbi:MAG: hypothetical protein NWE89_17515 [Candidatus Bathyarchaeota archaeon]|nr:hypothetical protein [Candidatus Bathyarchaeota archaeon]
MPVANLSMTLAKQHLRVMACYPMGPRGSPVNKKMCERAIRYNDVHSGVNETAAALLHFPELVEMWRLDDWEPQLKINPQLKEYMDPDRDDYGLVNQIVSASREPKTDDLPRTASMGPTIPTADPEEYKQRFVERMQFYVDFINLWKTIPVPKGFSD